jgi:hypothetical protein
VGDTITLAASVTGGVWAITGTHASIAAGNIIGVSAGTASVYYYATNTCGTDTANYSVTVMPLPDAGAITAGSDTVCEGTTITFTETASGGVWSSSNPTVATVNSGGAVAAVSPGTVSITYTVTNSCGTATAARILVIQDSTDCTMGVIGGTEHKPALQVYPNPTDGAINVVLGANSAQVTLMLCDMSGRILAEIQRENTRKVAFRCNELAGGIYTLTVIADGQVSHHKIIVQ